MRRKSKSRPIQYHIQTRSPVLQEFMLEPMTTADLNLALAAESKMSDRAYDALVHLTYKCSRQIPKSQSMALGYFDEIYPYVVDYFEGDGDIRFLEPSACALSLPIIDICFLAVLLYNDCIFVRELLPYVRLSKRHFTYFIDRLYPVVGMDQECISLLTEYGFDARLLQSRLFRRF